MRDDKISVLLKAPDKKNDQTVHSDRFAMVGQTLFDASGKTIVTQDNGLWRAGPGVVYVSIDFESLVVVLFKNVEVKREEKFGPFKVRIINGGIWGFDGSPELLAQLDVPMGVWHIVERPAVAMPEFTIS